MVDVQNMILTIFENNLEHYYVNLQDFFTTIKTEEEVNEKTVDLKTTSEQTQA